jgi:hypothetical protein
MKSKRKVKKQIKKAFNAISFGNNIQPQSGKAKEIDVTKQTIENALDVLFAIK